MLIYIITPVLMAKDFLVFMMAMRVEVLPNGVGTIFIRYVNTSFSSS
jgi:hypothetical protein